MLYLFNPISPDPAAPKTFVIPSNFTVVDGFPYGRTDGLVDIAVVIKYQKDNALCTALTETEAASRKKRSVVTIGPDEDGVEQEVAIQMFDDDR